MATPPVGHECSDKAAKQPKDGALREQLAGDASLAGAQGNANSDFLRPPCRAAQKEIRYVRARNQEH